MINHHELRDGNGKLIATVCGHDVNEEHCDEGIWLEMHADDGTRPTLGLIKSEPGHPHFGEWSLIVYRDAKTATNCELALTFSKNDGPTLQVTKGNDVKSANLFDLISKLEGC